MNSNGFLFLFFLFLTCSISASPGAQEFTSDKIIR